MYRTDTQGTIRVMTDGKSLRIAALGPETGSERPMPTGALAKRDGADGSWGRLAGGKARRDAPKVAQPARAVRAAPHRPRPEGPQSQPVAPALATRDNRPSAGSKLDLNSATASQLDALPGIGPGKAETIVNWRNRHGPFSSIEQLDDVPGIGPATVAGLRARVEVKSDRGGS